VIAVILPIYNQERYLAKALDSLSAQTHLDWVAICVDDGSTDATPRILADYVSRDGRFKLLRKPNGGVSSARNAGLDSLARTPEVTHVAFLDPDDFYHPQCLELAIAAAHMQPGAVISWGYANEDPEGFLSRRHSVAEIRLDDHLSGSEVWNKLYPVDVVRDVRFFEGSAIAEDAAYLVELFHRHHPSCRSLSLELGFYCEHGASNMHRNLTESDFVERCAVVRRMLKTFADDPDERMDFCRGRLPGILKRFYRDTERVVPEEETAARRVFCAMLRELRMRGLLKPQRGSFKDLKYYLRFLLMSRRGK